MPILPDHELDPRFGFFREALGEAFTPRLEAFRATSSGPFLAPEEESIAFCRFVAGLAHDDEDRRLADFARLAEGLLWSSWDHPREIEEAANDPTLIAQDRVEASVALQAPESHAPLRGPFLHLKRFRYLPPGYEEAPISSDGVYFLLFHKRPGHGGNHWPVTRLTARLVEDCDGQSTVADLYRAFGERTGQPEAVRPLIEQNLTLLADSGLIVLLPRGAKGS